MSIYFKKKSLLLYFYLFMYYNICQVVRKMNILKKTLMIISIAIISFIIIISVSYNIITNYKLKNIKVHDQNIVFYGDSITEGYNVKEFFDEENVVNSGISGNVTKNLIDRIDTDLYDYNPSLVIILIGTNDINTNVDDKTIIDNIEKIIKGIRMNRKNADIMIESIYPINREMNTEYWDNKPDYTNEHIIKLNKSIKKMCKKYNIKYIDVYSCLLDDQGNLKKIYSIDGLHLTDLGYYKVTKVIKKYI